MGKGQWWAGKENGTQVAWKGDSEVGRKVGVGCGPESRGGLRVLGRALLIQVISLIFQFFS